MFKSARNIEYRIYHILYCVCLSFTRPFHSISVRLSHTHTHMYRPEHVQNEEFNKVKYEIFTILNNAIYSTTMTLSR